MKKIKYHKCEFCGKEVFWKYSRGKKVLADKSEDGCFARIHDCRWD